MISVIQDYKDLLDYQNYRRMILCFLIKNMVGNQKKRKLIFFSEMMLVIFHESNAFASDKLEAISSLILRATHAINAFKKEEWISSKS